MNKTGFLSIVVPCFNVEKYVGVALDSIVAQSIAPDQVIVVDDGSTDRTREVLRSYEHHQNFRIVQSPNRGLGPARNLGRSLAQSEYVYFFDADDLLEPDFIFTMQEAVKTNDKPDLVMFAGEPFLDKGYNRLLTRSYFRNATGLFTHGYQLINEQSRRGEVWASACLYISKIELWTKNRLLFPAILHEDEAVLFPLIALSNKTVVMSKVLHRRRLRPGSIMTSEPGEQNIKGYLHILIATMQFMKREKVLVGESINAWRNRLAQFGARYISLSEKKESPINWGPVLSSLIMSRSIKYLAVVLSSITPEFVKVSVGRIKSGIRSAQD